jgi:hypothetical protein
MGSISDISFSFPAFSPAPWGRSLTHDFLDQTMAPALPRENTHLTLRTQRHGRNDKVRNSVRVELGWAIGDPVFHDRRRGYLSNPVLHLRHVKRQATSEEETGGSRGRNKFDERTVICFQSSPSFPSWTSSFGVNEIHARWALSEVVSKTDDAHKENLRAGLKDDGAEEKLRREMAGKTMGPPSTGPGSFRAMHPGNCGNLGNVGNVECVTCRAHYPGDETNPPSPLSRSAKPCQ